MLRSTSIRFFPARITGDGDAQSGVPLSRRAWLAGAGLALTPRLAAAPSQRRSPLALEVLSAVQGAGFDGVIDFGSANEDRDVPAGSARPVAHPPNVDVAVLQFDRQGRVIDWANVLLSRDYPRGVSVPATLDRGAWSVRFRRWEIDRWNGGTFAPGGRTPLTPRGWDEAPPLTDQDDLVPGRSRAPFRFMSPYPASLFKLLVAVQIYRMIDAGLVVAGTPVTFQPPGASPETRPLRDWLDPMLTVSDNRATQALLQFLHRSARYEVMNREFLDLGLDSLQINQVRATDGRGWQTDRIHMTAFDTARLLWLIEAPRMGTNPLWNPPGARPVSRNWLREESRRDLRELLEQQALNEALSTANLAGVPHVRPGIPSGIHPRWIHPNSGRVVADGIDFGVDVRESNARAEVNFAHKTGLTYNYASDAGIVRSLPGQPFRHYVVAFISNLGYRYTDEPFARDPRGPYARSVSPIAYSQRIPALGRAIDEAVLRLSRSLT